MRDDLGDPGLRDEVGGQRGRIVGGGDDVEVAHGLAAPPNAAGLGHPHGSRMRTQFLDRLVHGGQDAPEKSLLLDRLPRLGERGEHFLLGLRPEALDLCEPPLLGGCPEVLC